MAILGPEFIDFDGEIVRANNNIIASTYDDSNLISSPIPELQPPSAGGGTAAYPIVG